MAVLSRLAIVVEPVVVRPDIDSKNAPAKPNSGIDKKMGRLAYSATISQLMEVKTNASLTPIIRGVPRAPSTKAIPLKRLIAAEIRKWGQTEPAETASAIAGIAMDMDRITSRRPTTKKIERILATVYLQSANSLM